jgi:hypothetical protein
MWAIKFIVAAVATHFYIKCHTVPKYKEPVYHKTEILDPILNPEPKDSTYQDTLKPRHLYP